MRLRGPLAHDPTAKVLHGLLVGVLSWFAVIRPFLLPLIVQRAASLGAVLFTAAACVLALSFLWHGRLRAASLVYLWGIWVMSTATILMNQGIHSVALVYYITLPITGAWLFGYRVALGISAFCVASTLLMALWEGLGLAFAPHVPGTPIGIWTMVTAATIMTTVPAARVLQILKEALAKYQTAQESLRKYQGHLEELVEQRTTELVEARDEAWAANRAKSTFLANMSHELRTPLNAILGYSTLVRGGLGLSEGQRKDLDIIRRSGEHLLDLIDEVLDFAKIDTGNIAVSTAAFDLCILVHEVVDLMRLRAQAKSLAFFFDRQDGCPCCIRSDAGKLRQVLVNLIGNAVKYTDQGSVTLKIRLSPLDHSGRLLLNLEVLDTGTGIAPDDLERIFEPFVQVGDGGVPKGTGLGLSISRRLVESMGGRIRVESKLGEGSLFRVELPVEFADEGVPSDAHPSNEEVAGLAPGQPEYRMLIIEDQREDAALLERLLLDAGFRVCVAENGLDGLKVFRIWNPDLIWIDLNLPGMSGLETVRRMRQMERGQEVKIAAITVSVFHPERDELLASGLDDCLRTPYRRREILDCIQRTLGVRYTYGAGASPSRPVETGVAVTPESMSVLPEELRGELENALILLDVNRVMTLIHRVGEHDPALGGAMATLADKLAYTAMLHAVAARKASAGEGQM